MKTLFHKFTEIGNAQASGFGRNGPWLNLGDTQPELNILKLENFELIAIDALYPGALAQKLDNSILVANHTHFMPSLDHAKPLLGEFKPDYLNSILKIRQSAEYRNISDRLNLSVYRAVVKSICYRRWDGPKNFIRLILSRTGTMYPDFNFQINQDIIVFSFSNDSNEVEFAFVYHSNHPTNTHRGKSEFGSDFWDIIRKSVRERFGQIPIFCFPGNIGDVRSNITKKRFKLIPNIPINRKFTSYKDQVCLDAYYSEYKNSISEMTLINTLEIEKGSITRNVAELNVAGEKLFMDILNIAEYQFRFFPFEVSSLFEKRHNYTAKSKKFNVSCSGYTRGYLPHLKQIPYGGYEVSDSLTVMGLTKIQRVSVASERFVEIDEYE